MTSIPFVDLRAQYARLKPEIDRRIQTVLDHGQFIMGPEVEALEARLAAYVGCQHVVGVSSGTDALLMALMAEGVGPGDAVFVPTFTFTATAEVVLLLGATPIFVDVRQDTFNLDHVSLEEQYERVETEGKLRPRVVIAVDLFGLPADYERLHRIAQAHGLLVVADAAQSVGGRLGEDAVGRLTKLTTTSFFPAKPLGGYGDGGALFTDDTELAARLRSIRLHGQGEDRYDIVRLGLNGRLDSLQAAVLLAKLTVFEDELQRRDELARFYDRHLSAVVTTPFRPANYTSAWAQYTLQLDDRERMREALAKAGVPTAIYYPRPMHLQPAFVELGQGPGSLPASESLSERVLSLPMHPYLPESIAEDICTLVTETATA